MPGRAIRTTRARPSSRTDSTLAGAVDVALDDVAAEPVAGAQRQLEVDRVARRRAAPSELRRSVSAIDVGGEAVAVGLDAPSGRRR